LAVPVYFGASLEIVKDLVGCSTVRKNISVLTCVALLCILHYTHLQGIISYWNSVVWSPKAEAVFPSQAPFIHLGTSAFIGLVPAQIPDQPPFII